MGLLQIIVVQGTLYLWTPLDEVLRPASYPCETRATTAFPTSKLVHQLPRWQQGIPRPSVLSAQKRASRQSLLCNITQSNYGGLLGSHAAATGTSEVELLVTGVLPRPPDAPLVDDWDCLRV